jgi:hypothetical protein
MAAIWARVDLLIDIWSMKVFLWLLGQNAEFLDSHLFFFDRYSELAYHYRLAGRTAKAEKFRAIAVAHFLAAPDDDNPPEAAAMGMPVPPPPLNTNAISTVRIPKPRHKRPSGLIQTPVT